MTVLTCASTGKSITLLGEEIANSGEAKIWRTNQNGYLAKIYHSPTPERVQKLAVMIANPPTEPNSHLHHVSFAWPKSALKNAQGDCVGFLMPEIKDGKELIDVYNPRRRKALKLEIDWRFLHTTALNIVSIIEALHAAGYVLGDIKPQNILVNNRALPSIIDTDSFQVKNPKNGKVYRCLVGSPGYTPPELMGKDFDIIEQTEIHDRFRLGVIIYQLLFGGNNHFQGKWTGAGETPEPDEIIRRGLWLYSPNSLIEPVARTIPMIIVHPAIRECFLKCFNDGHNNPNLRPTARQWLEALRTGNDNLTICGRVDSHTVSIPTALLDDVNKISLSLMDYPDQKVKLEVVDIPVKPFESQKSTYDELNNIIVTATEDSDKLYQAQALAKNLNIESLLQAIRLADSIKQDSYLYQKSQKLIAELGRNILKLAQEQMDRRNADTALEIARNIPPIPSLQSEIDDFLVLGEAQNSAFIGTVAGLETAISQAQQIDTSRKVYKKAQELIARWQLEIEDLSPQ